MFYRDDNDPAGEEWSLPKCIAIAAIALGSLWGIPALLSYLAQ